MMMVMMMMVMMMMVMMMMMMMMIQKHEKVRHREKLGISTREIDSRNPQVIIGDRNYQ